MSAPPLSKWIRLTVYSYLTGNEILTKIALLGKKERELLHKAKLLGDKTLNLTTFYD
jgi:hypothetical protein